MRRVKMRVLLRPTRNERPLCFLFHGRLVVQRKLVAFCGQKPGIVGSVDLAIEKKIINVGLITRHVVFFKKGAQKNHRMKRRLLRG